MCPKGPESNQVMIIGGFISGRPLFIRPGVLTGNSGEREKGTGGLVYVATGRPHCQGGDRQSGRGYRSWGLGFHVGQGCSCLGFRFEGNKDDH
jgi:hypothetical protein